MQAMTLTEGSHKVFMMYAEDADNWSGTPWVSEGNISLTGAQRGNLSDLVKKGLIKIEGVDNMQYVVFTEDGKAYAAANGLNTEYWG